MWIVTTNKDFSDRIKVSFPCEPQLVAKVKTIENYKWHKDRKYWSFPTHSKTTEIYTHVSTKNIGKIKSPLDNLTLHKGGGE